MKTLKNQTLFQCSYCNKRLLTKKGARIHEYEYCQNPGSPNQIEVTERKEKCQHDNVETMYSYIPGEAVKEPDYDLCIDCGAHC